MTQEEKDLLLKDLCARLPYGVKGNYLNDDGTPTNDKLLRKITIIYNHLVTASGHDGMVLKGYIKPYLFPLSSMTEEQKEELFKLCEFCIREDWEGRKSEVYAIEIASRPDPVYCYDHTFRMWSIDMRTIDWLLKNHFDIYGLIPMDLAIDATGKNIYD